MATILKKLQEYTKSESLHLALGNFDGVHLGHQKLIRGAVDAARRGGGLSAVLIFDPHPLKVVAPKFAPRLLIDNKRKFELIQALGVDVLITAEFTNEMARWSPEQFAGMLTERLAMASAHVGFNYTFGHKGSGTPELLSELGKSLGFEVDVAGPVKVDDSVVSSTLIRGCLEEGNVVLARRLLGHFPVMSGPVVHGEERGRTIGFPTANVGIAEDMLVPAPGVYASVVRCRGSIFSGVTNVGRKPTFHDEYPVVVETHILDFSENIYGERADVFLLERLRGEIRFSGPGELMERIKADAEETRRVIDRIPFTPLYA